MSLTAEDPIQAPPAPSPAPSRSGSVKAVGRRTRVVVRKVGPLSVLKFSLLFYFCVMLIVYFDEHDVVRDYKMSQTKF